MNRGWIPPGMDIDAFQTHRFGPMVELNKAQRAREARALDHVIVPSEYLKRMVTGWGVAPERISVIYNAHRQREDSPQVSQAEARRQLGLPEGPLLLTPARLAVWKGIDHSLRALVQIEGVRLVVAGDGPERANLERLAGQIGVADRVSFLGRVPNEQMALHYRAADYTLLYSGYEGLSHVLVESMAAGTPAIASDKSGNPEVIRHGENGLLAAYPDVDALAATLREALSPGRRDALAAHTGEGLDRFDWDRMVEQTIEVLESALTRR